MIAEVISNCNKSVNNREDGIIIIVEAVFHTYKKYKTIRAVV